MRLLYVISQPNHSEYVNDHHNEKRNESSQNGDGDHWPFAEICFGNVTRGLYVLVDCRVGRQVAIFYRHIYLLCNDLLRVKVGRIEQSRTHKKHHTEQLVSFEYVRVFVRYNTETIHTERDLNADGGESEYAFDESVEYPSVDASRQCTGQTAVLAALECKEKKAYTQIEHIWEAINQIVSECNVF